MSHNRNPFAFRKPITLDNLGELFAHHRGLTGGWSMDANNTGGNNGGDGSGDGASGSDQQATRPDGISEDEWNALGDPGRAAIVREREARQAAERALAASRARPKAPDDKAKSTDQGDKPKGGGDGSSSKDGDGVDVEAMIQRAVAAAVKPFQEREEEREAEQAADRVRTAVLDAAKPRFHDATDALAQIDLRTVLDGNGAPDEAKIASAIDDLVKRKPHLAKVVDDRRHGQDGTGATAGGSTRPLNDRVSEKLSRMQERAGVKFAATE